MKKLRFVKFIVHPDMGVFFGEKEWSMDGHRPIASNYDVPTEYARGGFADLEEKRIFGTSEGLGSYDPEIVKKFLPDWKIDEPSNEKPPFE